MDRKIKAEAIELLVAKKKEVTYNFLRTLTAEQRPYRKEGTARPGMIRVVETRNMLEEEPCPNPLYL